MPLKGYEIQAEAFRMFEKWKELFAPDYDSDILELVSMYVAAPPEQHAEACRKACVLLALLSKFVVKLFSLFIRR